MPLKLRVYGGEVTLKTTFNQGVELYYLELNLKIKDPNTEMDNLILHFYNKEDLKNNICIIPISENTYKELKNEVECSGKKPLLTIGELEIIVQKK